MFNRFRYQPRRKARSVVSAIDGRGRGTRSTAVCAAIIALTSHGAAAQQPEQNLSGNCNDVSMVTIAPSSVLGSSASRGTVTLRKAAKPGGLQVQLASDDSLAVTVPTQINVPAGAVTAQFPIQTAPVAADTHVFISAFCGNDRKHAARYQISVRPPRLVAIEIPKSLRPGAAAVGKVILTGPAPSAGFTVELMKGAYLATPASVVVPAGQLEALFEIHVEKLVGQRTAGVTGRAGGAVIPSTTKIDPNASPPSIPVLSAPRVASTPPLTHTLQANTPTVAPVTAVTSVTSETEKMEVATTTSFTPIPPVDPLTAIASGFRPTSATAVASATTSGAPCEIATMTGEKFGTALDPKTAATSADITSATLATPDPTHSLVRVWNNPNDFKAVAIAPANVRLSWAPVDGVKCYLLWESGTHDAVNLTATVYEITNVPGGSHQYKLLSIDDKGRRVDEGNPSTASVDVAPGPFLDWYAMGFRDYTAVAFDNGTTSYADTCCSNPKEEIVSRWKKIPVFLDGRRTKGSIKLCKFEATGPDGLHWSVEKVLGTSVTNTCGDERGLGCRDITTTVGCYDSVELRTDADSEVSLTVTYDDGSTASTTAVVRPHDFLIVALGDSYGSGEGAPPFVDARCDRSILSAQAQVALDLEKSDPHTSVTFIHLACSGAQIEDPEHNMVYGSSFGMETEPGGDGGLVHGYPGVHPTGDVILLPQIEAVRRLLDQDDDKKLDRPIDALLISIGGNDANFADIIISCGAWPLVQMAAAGLTVGGVGAAGVVSGLVGAAFLDLPFPCSFQDPLGTSAYYIFEKGKAELEPRFSRLRAELQAKLGLDTTLTPNRVYLWQYPIATQNEEGQYCNGTDLFFGGSFPPTLEDLPKYLGGGQGILAGFSAAEFEWADKTVGPDLNGMIHGIAAKYGWTYIATTADPFRRHGLCAKDNWLVRPYDSFQLQGDKFGTFHPTAAGYRAMADKISESVIYWVKQGSGL